MTRTLEGVVLLDVLTAVVLALVALRLGDAARISLGDRRSEVVSLYRSIRPRHVLGAVTVLPVVFVAAVLSLQVPGLNVGWWAAIGGIGNPVAGTTESTTGTWLEWALPIAFLVALLPALPLFAEREERWFRLGAHRRTWGQRRLRDITFGLVHALVGIPIGVALSLAIGGAYFTTCYLRGYRRGGVVGALRESTLAHLTYNLTVVVLALVGFTLLALGAA
jgi:hypothetical protein